MLLFNIGVLQKQERTSGIDPVGQFSEGPVGSANFRANGDAKRHLHVDAQQCGHLSAFSGPRRAF